MEIIMLSIPIFIKKAQEHPNSYFLYMLETLIDEQVIYLSNDLESKKLWDKNPTLLKELELTLKKIQQKESWLQKLLKLFIPLNYIKKTHKKKLTVLLDQLNVNIYHLEQDIQKNKEIIKNITNTLNYLEQLKVGLSHNKFFINEIDDKIIILKGYNLTLSLKEVNLLELKKVYQIMNIKD